MLSTEMARSSALNFLNSGITIAYNDNWSVQTGLQSAGQNARITGCPRKSFRDTFWSGVLLREKLGAVLPGSRTESTVFAIFLVFNGRCGRFRAAPLLSDFLILRLFPSCIKLVFRGDTPLPWKELTLQSIPSSRYL